MTTPQEEPPPPQEKPPATSAPPVQVEPEEEESTLLPALLIAYVVYRTWRGSHQSIPTGYRQVIRLLKLRELIGRPLAMIAARALDSQRSAAGRSGDELWMHTEASVLAGVDAGLQAVAEALVWNDQHGMGSEDSETSRSGGHSTRKVIPDEPPTLLANLAAAAAMNGAVFAAASAAGWTGKQWKTRLDNRVRDTHRGLEGKKTPLNTAFVSASGAKLRYPGDPKAPMAERANCRCYLRILRQ